MELARPGRAISLLALLCTTACAHSSAPHDPETFGPYRLGADDLVEVYVFKDPDLTRTIPVRPDGHITLPLIGDIDVAGLTTQEARAKIATKFRKWITDPNDVAVIVHEIHSTSIFVTGEVVKPGAFPLHAATTVLQAIAMAGGLGEFSARSDATVVRAGSGEKVVVSITDPSDAGTLMLRPGDTVVVR
jgi:polysaccharide export outer membrane protein